MSAIFDIVIGVGGGIALFLPLLYMWYVTAYDDTLHPHPTTFSDTDPENDLTVHDDE